MTLLQRQQRVDVDVSAGLLPVDRPGSQRGAAGCTWSRGGRCRAKPEGVRQRGVWPVVVVGIFGASEELPCRMACMSARPMSREMPMTSPVRSALQSMHDFQGGAGPCDSTNPREMPTKRIWRRCRNAVLGRPAPHCSDTSAALAHRHARRCVGAALDARPFAYSGHLAFPVTAHARGIPWRLRCARRYEDAEVPGRRR